jgi:hypothetical protein
MGPKDCQRNLLKMGPIDCLGTLEDNTNRLSESLKDGTNRLSGTLENGTNRLLGDF